MRSATDSTDPSAILFEIFLSFIRPSAIQEVRLARFLRWLEVMVMQTVNEDLDLRIEPATVEDLDDLTELVMDLFRLEEDFEPDRAKQQHGLKLVLEQPNRGRIFVVKNAHKIVAMVNLLFTISTAEGGMVIVLEDLIVHPDHRRQGHGGRLLDHVLSFAQKRGFLRITLLTDRISNASQEFFAKHGFTKSQMIPMRRAIEPEPS